MQIDIPEAEQWLRAEIMPRRGQRFVVVFIGEAEVYEHQLENDSKLWYDIEDELLEGVTAFGKMLALKIGD